MGDVVATMTDTNTGQILQHLPEFLALYNLVELSPPVLIEQGEDNLNFRVDTRTGRVVVRRYERSAQEDIPFELETLSYLSQQHYPVPAVFRTQTGSLLAHLAGKPAIIMEYIDGTYPSPYDPTIPRLIGQWLAEYHLVVEHFVPQSSKNFHELTRLELLQQYAQSAPNFPYTDFLSSIATLYDKYRSYLTISLPQLPCGVIHSDFRPDNLLCEGRQLRAVLDFDTCYMGSFIRDIAETTLIWSMPEKEVIPISEIIQELLAGYQQVRPLLPEEKTAFYPSTLIACLADAAGYLLRQIIAGKPASRATDSMMYVRYLNLLECPSLFQVE